jgi:putative ABC transport system permease protein
MTLSEFVRDVQYAIRSLSRTRTFVLVAVASLGLGIGADTAAFSLVDAVVWRPLPFPSPDQLVDLHEWSATKLCQGCSVGTSSETYGDWRAAAKSFSAMGAYQEEAMALTVGGQVERVGGSLVSASLFSTLGVQARIGRVFTEAEDRVGGPAIVVISHDLWLKRFAGDTNALGRSVRLNGVQRTIVGIMPRDFRFPEFAALWVPLGQTPASHDRNDRNLGVIARLAEGVDLARANVEMLQLARPIAREHPETNAEWTAKATTLRDDLAGTESELFVILLGAVTLVLLIVCANLAGLSLARGSARRRELAIRLALGASRARVVRLLLAESAILAVAGGALGVLLAWWTVDFVSAQFAGFIPFWIQFRIDARVLTFAAGASALTTLAFGLMPALRASRPDVKAELQDGGSNASMGQGGLRLRAALVIGELSIALVLLAASGLLIKTFLRISEPDHVDRRGLLTAQIELLDQRYADSSRVITTANDLLQRISTIPTVTFVGMSRTFFLAGFGAQDNRVRVENLAEVPEGVSPRFAMAITPDYFRAMRSEIAAGRAFNDIDRAGAEPVVILDERVARGLWPDGRAIGRRMKLVDSADAPWLTVVGLTRDPETRPGGPQPRGMAYVPLAQSPGRPLALAIRVNSERPLTIAPSVRTAVSQVDADLPLLDFMSAEDAHARQYWPFKLYAIVMSSFASLAIMLAIVGVYGIVAYGVTQRSREIGVRVALGASQQDVVLLLLRQGLQLAGAGIAIGVLLSFAVLRVMQGMMFGASTTDPTVMLAVAVIVAASAVLASWLPARRAASADPALALRVD